MLATGAEKVSMLHLAPEYKDCAFVAVGESLLPIVGAKPDEPSRSEGSGFVSLSCGSTRFNERCRKQARLVLNDFIFIFFVERIFRSSDR